LIAKEDSPAAQKVSGPWKKKYFSFLKGKPSRADQRNLKKNEKEINFILFLAAKLGKYTMLYI